MVNIDARPHRNFRKYGGGLRIVFAALPGLQREALTRTLLSC
jgi:hypothetical protein